MALYLVGDLQGCYDELCRLLETVRFDPSADQLWLCGDLVARGPHSLATLRLVHSLGDAAQTVLGNHDLHLLSTHAGLAQPKPKDYLDDLLNASDCDSLIDWLRHQPMLLRDPERKLMVTHAGIPPQWDLQRAPQLASEVEEVLRSDRYVTLLQQMYGSEPTSWHEQLSGIDRLRYIINALTRMRYCHSDGSLDLACKMPPSQAPVNLHPWFELPRNNWQGYTVIFGHWASLMGNTGQRDAIALDTGCVWGQHLTLLRWDDRQYFTQPTIAG